MAKAEEGGSQSQTSHVDGIATSMISWLVGEKTMGYRRKKLQDSS